MTNETVTIIAALSAFGGFVFGCMLTGLLSRPAADVAHLSELLGEADTYADRQRAVAAAIKSLVGEDEK